MGYKKRCHQCGKKLGLGVRFRNLFVLGRWVHLRYCSKFCESLDELERANANRQTKWLSYLGSGS